MSGYVQGVARTVERCDNIRPVLKGIAELEGRVGSLVYRWVALLELWFVLICFGASICRCMLRVIHLLHITHDVNARCKDTHQKLSDAPVRRLFVDDLNTVHFFQFKQSLIKIKASRMRTNNRPPR